MMQESNSAPLSFWRLYAYFAFACTFIFIVNFLLADQINRFGVYPREIYGLPGILFHPFLHGSIAHLTGNLVSFAVLAYLTQLHSLRRLCMVAVIGTLITGSLVWLFGRPSYHIGLSSTIYVLWGYLLAYGFFRRSIKSVIIASAIVFFYGSMVWGVLPAMAGISFESHLFGAFAGGLLGLKLGKSDKANRSAKRGL